MKVRFPAILALILALVLVHAGLARAQLLLCRYQCEQVQQVHAAPCCKSGAGEHHDGNHGQAGAAEDCPHVVGIPHVSDFSLTAPFTKVAPPALSFAVAAYATRHLVPAEAEPAYQYRPDAAPPGFATIPLYHRFCSLLI